MCIYHWTNVAAILQICVTLSCNMSICKQHTVDYMCKIFDVLILVMHMYIHVTRAIWQVYLLMPNMKITWYVVRKYLYSIPGHMIDTCDIYVPHVAYIAYMCSLSLIVVSGTYFHCCSHICSVIYANNFWCWHYMPKVVMAIWYRQSHWHNNASVSGLMFVIICWHWHCNESCTSEVLMIMDIAL